MKAHRKFCEDLQSGFLFSNFALILFDRQSITNEFSNFIMYKRIFLLGVLATVVFVCRAQDWRDEVAPVDYSDSDEVMVDSMIGADSVWVDSLDSVAAGYEEPTRESLVKAGLPENAVPAKYYFDTYGAINMANAWKEENITTSALNDEEMVLDGVYYFFVSETNNKLSFDETRKPIEIWVYDDVSRKVRRIFQQSGTDLLKQEIMEINWNLDIKSQNSCSPVVVLSADEALYEDAEGIHTGNVVDVVDVQAGKVKILHGQKFIGFYKAESNELGEDGCYAKRYILTKTCDYKATKLAPVKSSDGEGPSGRATFSSRLNAFTIHGTLVGTINFPSEQIDLYEH